MLESFRFFELNQPRCHDRIEDNVLWMIEQPTQWLYKFNAFSGIFDGTVTLAINLEFLQELVEFWYFVSRWFNWRFKWQNLVLTRWYVPSFCKTCSSCSWVFRYRMSREMFSHDLRIWKRGHLFVSFLFWNLLVMYNLKCALKIVL